MEVLIINGHDYSKFIERKGYRWSRNDLDSGNTTRTKSGKLRREKLATKRKCSYTLMNMTQEELAQLDNDLNADEFSATFLDLHGVQTRIFYCSSFTAICAECDSEGVQWEGASFNMIEV